MRVGADPGAEVVRNRHDSHRADGTQIGDDVAASVRDRRLHLRERRAAVEAHDRDPEGIRFGLTVGGSSGEERRGANRQENKPLHRNPGFGSEGDRLYDSIPQLRGRF